MPETLKALIRDIPDFPKPGIIFKDITPVLANAQAFMHAIDLMAQPFQKQRIDKVVCVEARGFIFGAPVAHRLQAGVIPVRKPGKLPFATHKVTYQLEYGTDSLEMHADAILPGENVLIVDDVLATGGTTAGVVELLKQQQANIIGLSFLIELDFLHGRQKLPGLAIESIIHY